MDYIHCTYTQVGVSFLFRLLLHVKGLSEHSSTWHLPLFHPSLVVISAPLMDSAVTLYLCVEKLGQHKSNGKAKAEIVIAVAPLGLSPKDCEW